jgi:peroxiredoxin
VAVKTENAIGVRGKERLVPWLRNNGQQGYLVVLTDPRPNSFELQQAVENIQNDLSADIRGRILVVNADTPAENRRWLKKSGLDGQLELYSDEKMEWMRAYTALGDQRWSMTMFIIANGKVEKLARDLDQYGATRAISNAVKSLKAAR